MYLLLEPEKNGGRKGLHKADDCDDFDHGEEKLRFPITPNPKQIDHDDNKPEYGNKGGLVRNRGPEFDGYRGGGDLEWEYNQPLHRIANAYIRTFPKKQGKQA
jgi:hypothetical protein